MLEHDEVVWAFRYLFGRDPESNATIEAHSNFDSWRELRIGLLASDEFQNTIAIRRIMNKWVLTDVMGGRRKMWLDLGDRYVSHACLLDNYEPIETAFIREHLKEGDSFLDIGANIGWYTILASTIVGEHGRINSFEPRATTFRYLAESIALNGLNGLATVHNCGLSDHEGVAYINNAVDTDNPGGSFVSEGALGGMESFPISLRTLDSYNFDKVDFIKIDVEGSEPKVFAGGAELIRRDMPIIMAEVNDAALRNVSNVSGNEMIRFFVDLGYQAQILDHRRNGELIERIPDDWDRDIMNIGLIPLRTL